MTEPANDNDPVNVNFFVTNEEVQDPGNFLSNEGGNNDFFVCRKCNKVFHNLSQYVEHKVREENFSIGRTYSTHNRRIILPTLVQKEKRKAATLESNKSKKAKTDSATSHSEGKQSADHQGNAEQERNATLPSSHPLVNGLYACKQCPKTFKREAALVRHLKYDHRESEDEFLASDSEPDQDIPKDDDNDKDFTAEPEKKNDDPGTKENAEPKTQEIVIVIENPPVSETDKTGPNADKPGELKKVTVDLVDIGSEPKRSAEENTKGKRPCICKVCGRTFKEQAVLKAHALVHSEQRKFVCTVENCPYAFKTKGGLVRHMRRHTGARPFSCDKCGRHFAESGSLTRHLKARRNCAALSDKAYPRYMKNWTYHPNIPAVVDPAQRDPHRGRNTLGPGHFHRIERTGEEVHYYITEFFDDSASVSSPTVITVTSSDVSASLTTAATGEESAASTAVATCPLEKVGHVGKSADSVSVGGSLSVEADDEILVTQKTTSEAEVVVEKGNIGVEETSVVISSESQQHEKEKMGTALSLAKLSSAPSQSNSVKSTAVLHKAQLAISTSEAASSALASCVNSYSQSQQMSATVASTVAVETTPSTHHPQQVEMHRVENDEDLLELRASADAESLKLTQCHVCKKDFEAVAGLEIHLRTHLANESSRCGLCHFTAQDREELRHHILGMHHQSLNDIEASVLAMEVKEESLKKGETVQSRQLVLRHALTAVKQLYSLKKYKHPSEQDKPGLSTTGSVQCMVCNKFFRGSSYLRQHMRTHTGDRPHQCHHCGRSFTSRDILKKHMYVHQEHKDYKCGECGKLFKRLGHVQQHLRTHSQERTFRCSVCDKLFKTQHSLKVHLRTHSGINPYKCHICNNHFRERGSLQRHMRLHTGEKPFKCPMCNRGFSEQGTLSRHLKAKVPCSANREPVDAVPQPPKEPSVAIATYGSMLPQFSSLVSDSQQQIIINADQVAAAAPQGMEEGVGQQHFFVEAGQVHEVGSEYVVLQSAEQDSEDIQTVVVPTEVQLDKTVVDLGAVCGQEQVPETELQIPGTETLHVVDSSTGEAVVIVAEKAIVDLVREQHSALQATEGGCSLEKIKEILLGQRDSLATNSATSNTNREFIGDALPIKHDMDTPDSVDQQGQLAALEKDVNSTQVDAAGEIKTEKILQIDVRE